MRSMSFLARSALSPSAEAIFSRLESAGIPTACAIMAAVVLLTLPLCFKLRE